MEKQKIITLKKTKAEIFWDPAKAVKRSRINFFTAFVFTNVIRIGFRILSMDLCVTFQT